MTAPCLIFAGGGTGGHLFPGIAVADALRSLHPQAQITFMTTGRDLDRALLDRAGYERIPQVVRPFSTRPWHWPGFYLAWRRSIAAARVMMRSRPPTAVLGLGGYAAGPPVMAAARMGIRTAILNPDALPGRANRVLSRVAQAVFTQWEVSRDHLAHPERCRAVGCPIRAEFLGAAPERSAARAALGLDPGRRLLLVTGASQGAQSINDAMVEIWPTFAAEHPEWQVLHLSGMTHETALRDAYSRCGATATVWGFTHDMRTALAASDVVVSRAGASTLAELTAVGRASILLPYPYHRDRHQHANADVLMQAGAALLLEDSRSASENAGPLLAALRLLTDAGVREGMERAAAQMGRPRAALDVAGWLLGERALS
ncbi:MAG: UDP-N-acetylglucosamine--N-acetylmuramyl-(pentapeptide) pyrophosphoryl-undecaprenol N-acetylglucosamine transferase [Phycisphaerales bacterium]|nr:UDP-N-acetylglucosamine--N-acetylmuramyl-(pentapeptide) pyrophosphoryl-undecaprenol N-acetylglucosamine transferase [Phycisphaerales bacterium]